MFGSSANITKGHTLLCLYFLEVYMIELTNEDVQTVTIGQRILFDTVVTHTGCAEYHRVNSGGVVLTKPGKYYVSFGANVAVPTGVTPTEIELELNQDGDYLMGTTMRATPANAEEYSNVSTERIVDVFVGTTATISIANVGASNISVDNPNIIVRRIA